MGIRTYLTLSYLTIIILLLLGAWTVADRVLARVTESNVKFAEDGALKIATANYQLSKEVLTNLGEYVVRDKAMDVARELSLLLAGKKHHDYARIRRDPKIRRIAVQEIYTPSGPAGYTDLYDRQGFILFHPDKAVEGRNQLDWEKEYPETTALIRRSFREDLVTGYFNFFDKKKRERQRYAVRVHVPGTPFVVAAIINIDEYFRPTQEKMRQASQVVIAGARQRIVLYQERLQDIIQFIGLLAGGALCLIGGLFGILFAGAIARPISRLRDGVQQVGEGNFAVTVPERGVKEVVHLAQSFNLLGEQLVDYMAKRDFIRDTFGRYVTQEVVTKLLGDQAALEMGGETREVSLIMSDLRGFTAIIADMEPEQVIFFLNRYLDRMIEILLDHRAIIDEILGDGILAFFGAPEPLENHPARAVACALAMQSAMAEINAANAADGLPHLEMGIGVNTGTVVVGNIGSERRTKYSVVGSPVNFASRMEGYALGGQVLISAATYRRLQDLVEVRGSLTVEMKGVPEPATLYEVRGIGAPYNLRLAERSDRLALLSDQLGVLLARLEDKIVSGPPVRGWITHLSETAATVALEAEVPAWAEVRLTLLDADLKETPGYIYGKVTRVQDGAAHPFEADVSFTSVSPEVYRLLRQAAGAA
jgi:class 3 adenylate cyclase/HAMP domain-containing protein